MSLELGIRTPRPLFCIYSEGPENKATPSERQHLKNKLPYIQANTYRNPNSRASHNTVIASNCCKHAASSTTVGCIWGQQLSHI
jgi:hypothetical protein